MHPARFPARRFLILTLLLCGLAPRSQSRGEEQPLCRIAAISNLYLTALPAEQMPANRRFLTATAPIGIQRSLAAVKALKPDALVVLGSLTWTGADADYRRVQDALQSVKTPMYVTPGPNDRQDNGAARFEKYFGKVSAEGKRIRVRGVDLLFAGSGTQSQAEAVKRLQAMLDPAQAAGAKARLLLGGPEFREIQPAIQPTTLEKEYWSLIERGGIAARLTRGHAHNVFYAAQLPIWSVPSSGWSYSPKFAVALITVYRKRIDLSLIREAFQPPQKLEIPNPLAAPRLPLARRDPYRLPTYSQDLARKPELTFVQLSDSQFDDGTLPRYTARYRYDEPMNELAVLQVNRLNPAMVFMTGDLTNKNTEAEWKTFQRIYSRLKPPLHPLPGNHDTLYARDKLDRKTLGDLLVTGQQNWRLADRLAGGKARDRTALFQHFVKSKPYYTVERNGSVFICLNTGVAAVDPEQMKWLRTELERTRKAAHVFVLGHYPVLPAFGGNVAGPEGQEILRLLRKYRVTAYLSGHRHRYDYRMHEGVMHMLCDCLCWGEYRSYQIYHVFPDRIVACWKPIFRADGNRPLYERVEFPEPRADGSASR